MKIIFTILILIMPLFGYTIKELQAHKKASKEKKHSYKQTKQIKTTPLVVIFFNNIELVDKKQYEDIYSLKIRYCIVDSICVFKYDGKAKLEQNILNNIKKDNSNISKIYIQKKYNLKIY